MYYLNVYEGVYTKKKKQKKKKKFNLFCMSFNSIALQLHVYVTQFFLLP